MGLRGRARSKMRSRCTDLCTRLGGRKARGQMIAGSDRSRHRCMSTPGRALRCALHFPEHSHLAWPTGGTAESPRMRCDSWPRGSWRVARSYCGFGPWRERHVLLQRCRRPPYRKRKLPGVIHRIARYSDAGWGGRFAQSPERCIAQPGASSPRRQTCKRRHDHAKSDSLGTPTLP